MNILITGLTLHHNKGGPALALSLINKLNTQFDNPVYYMSVPNFQDNLQKERVWANFYGVKEVTGAIGVKHILPPFSWKRSLRMQKKQYVELMSRMDLIVDLTALSFMDLPHLTFKQNLARNLSIFTSRIIARRCHKPLIRWTQSYGPFAYRITKQIVQNDLKGQKHLFVRGEQSFKYMKELFDETRLHIFPDIAITLPSNTSTAITLKTTEPYVTVSPSSVLYSLNQEKHLQDTIDLIVQLQNRYKVVLVPHNLMTINPTPYNCDLEVCKLINSRLQNKAEILSEDLDVFSLKGIIANAYMHIGARYHSIIASLSSAVPTVSYAWHSKYQDIMQLYGMEKYVFEQSQPATALLQLVQELEENHMKIQNTLKKNQLNLEEQIHQNLVLFMENLHAL